ncbi:hydrogenase nickel incorporation protein HypB [Thiotrichales bacterium 19S11-10]|nr:hydrogenase nickel incorporation protein HypB [Thiotrichales bacterium 19S11-10]MCF6808004.1 hydrogenase nickel incorporation protein HypB [Thiotrichales bacterium 19S9-11]MCF6812019.1 hydrogenase nickel incorporation protein HypB [Thiotrichales bacterium 19S9-12]
MCTTCGCQDTTTHTHQHDHSSDSIRLERAILETNDRYAQLNRDFIKDKNSILLNFVSSPGSGKTSLLVKTIQDNIQKLPISVIEGDQYTELDAERIRKAGADAYQINTGKACHLDAHMISHAFEHLNIKSDGYVFIENVGNLICPSLFDLGESKRVALISVTEGDDKPLKYPNMFHSADIVIVNKVDLLNHVDFDMERLSQHVYQIQPKAKIIPLSVKSGEGLSDWYHWLFKLKTI